MINNYVKIIYRNIVRNKFYSLLNIIGLSIGIFSAILIFLYVNNELTYDKHHDKYERVYRLESDFTIAGEDDLFAITPVPLAPILKSEFPEIEEFVRFSNVGDKFIKFEEKQFYEDSLFFADSTIFKIFTHEFVKGKSEGILREPNTIVITENFAHKYFGNNDPLGKIFMFENIGPLKVTGVIKDLPSNLHLRFRGLISMSTLENLIGAEDFNSTGVENFWSISVYSYVLLKENADVQNILNNFQAFYEKYMAEVGSKINANFNLSLQPLADIHFNENSGLQADFLNGNKSYIYIFSLIAFLILLIAGINFMNMSTACSAKRAKEVGIRKVAGADKNMLVKQFLSESMTLTAIALILALIVIYFVIPYFNILAGTNLDHSIFIDPLFIIGALIIGLFLGLVSGSYPAFYLSSFSPIGILSKKVNSLKGRGILRKVLVIVQFIISLVIIITTFIVNRQQYYIQNKNLGFDKENILVLPVNDTIFYNKINVFRDELLKYSDVVSASTSSYVPGRGLNKVMFRVEDGEELNEQTLNFMFVDFNYLNMMGIKLKEGRFFDKDKEIDLTNSFVINETAANKLGWENDALGKRMQFGFDLEGNVARDGNVIGVINDFHFSSIHNEIAPFVMLLSDRFLDNISVRLKEDNIQSSINFIENKLKEFDIVKPVNYFFLDEYLHGLYSKEKKIAQLFVIFSILTIFISCLGLLGLSFFITEQRTKEIGIRKVLGSDSKDIAYLLSKDFLLLVIIANVFSWPVAYYFVNQWLQDFVYRIDLTYSSYMFFALLAGLLALFIALVTVNTITFRAIRANPVKVLRYE